MNMEKMLMGVIALGALAAHQECFGLTAHVLNKTNETLKVIITSSCGTSQENRVTQDVAPSKVSDFKLADKKNCMVSTVTIQQNGSEYRRPLYQAYTYFILEGSVTYATQKDVQDRQAEINTITAQKDMIIKQIKAVVPNFDYSWSSGYNVPIGAIALGEPTFEGLRLPEAVRPYFEQLQNIRVPNALSVGQVLSDTRSIKPVTEKDFKEEKKTIKNN